MKIKEIKGLMIEQTPCMGNPDMLLHPSDKAVNNTLSLQGEREIGFDREMLAEIIANYMKKPRTVESTIKDFYTNSSIELADAIIAAEKELIICKEI